MFSTDEIADAAGVGPQTIRGWFFRAPGFQLGRPDGAAKVYDNNDALALLISGELLSARIGQPHEVLPVARSLVVNDGNVWAWRDADGIHTSTHQPNQAAAVCIRLDVLSSRLRHIARPAGGRRMPRSTR